MKCNYVTCILHINALYVINIIFLNTNINIQIAYSTYTQILTAFKKQDNKLLI